MRLKNAYLSKNAYFSEKKHKSYTHIYQNNTHKTNQPLHRIVLKATASAKYFTCFEDSCLSIKNSRVYDYIHVKILLSN